ncbi:MAG: hypothetical protein AB8C84_07675, partial [Oligoflexales bacterium]
MNFFGVACLIASVIAISSCADPDPAFKEVNSTRRDSDLSEYNQSSDMLKNSKKTNHESILNQGDSTSVSPQDITNSHDESSYDQIYNSHESSEDRHPSSDGLNDENHQERNDSTSSGESNSEERELPDNPEGHGDLPSDEKGIQEVVARFPLVETEQHTVHLDPHTFVESIDLNLSHQKISEKKLYQQRNREWKSFHFQQKTSQGSREDVFEQNQARKVDILIVVDNSKSMKEEQKELAKRMTPLLSKIKKHDWKIAVTTTDPKDPCIRDVIDAETPNFENRFVSAIQAGIKGTGKEQGFRTAVRALRSSCRSSSWLRKQSQLAVLFVSDEDNCSDGNRCAGKSYGEVEYLLGELERHRTPQRDAKVYGLIWDPSTPKRLCSSGYNKGHQYSQAIVITGGHMGSICDENYSEFLSSVSNDIKSNLDRVYSLSSLPIENSIHVFVNGEEKTTGYSISKNTLEFDQAPHAGSEIHVIYQSYEEEPIKVFEFPQLIEPLTATVLVNGSLVKTGVHMSESQLEFEEAPAVGSEIRILYQSPDDLIKSFVIGNHVIESSLQIEISDLSRPEFQFDQQSGALTFFPNLKDGVTFTVDFERYHYTEEISYDFDYSKTIEVIQAEDHTTGGNIPVVYRNGKF